MLEVQTAAGLCLVLLLLLGTSTQGLAQVLVTREVEQPVILQAMLNTSVSRLVYGIPAFTLVEEAWKYITEQTPFFLSRDFTISSVAQPPTIIDFQFLQRRVVLGQGVTFTFKNVTLVNIRGSGELELQWFQLSKGATVVLDNVVVINLFCSSPAAVELQAAETSPKVRGYPPIRVRVLPQQLCMQFPVREQRCFPDAVHYDDFAAVISYTHPDTGAREQGYTVVYRNTTNLCLSYLDPKCVEQHGQNTCWEQQLQQLQQSHRGGAASPALSAGAAAGVAIAGVALLAAAAVLCCCLYKGRQRAAQQLNRALSTNSLQHGAFHQSGRLSPRSSNDAPGAGQSNHSRPSLSQSVQLGVLLGAGSFGRVFRGRYHNRDVAIKIMSCRSAELPKVLKEAEIMMQLEHEHIVRALYCTVVRPKAPGIGSTDQGGVQDGDRSNSTKSAFWHNNSGSRASASNAPSADAAAAVQHASGALSLGALDKQPSALANTSSSERIGHNRSHHGVTDQQQQQQQQQQVPQPGREPLQKPSRSRDSSGSSRFIRALPGLRAWLAGSRSGSDVQQRASPDRPGSVEVSHSSGGVAGVEVPLPTGGCCELQAEGTIVSGQVLQSDNVEVWLVMELCTGATLSDSFRNKPLKDSLDMTRLLCRLLEVAKGMAFLHSKGVLHGDLKAANVLLKNTIHGSYGQEAKISDFGLASTLLDGATHRSTQTMGTITHTAPEVLASGHLSPAADVYSFGIMMWELFTGSSAFKHLHYGAVVQRVVVSGERPPLPAEAPDEYKLLMCRCWDADPLQRPTFDQIAACLDLLLDNLESSSLFPHVNDGGGQASWLELVGQQQQQQQLLPVQPPQQQQASLQSPVVPAVSGVAGPDRGGNQAQAAVRAAQGQKQGLDSRHVQDL